MMLELENVMQSLHLKFKSGNSVPVERATITRKEWETIDAHLARQSEGVSESKARRCCGHASDCAVHNAPALPVAPCDCGYAENVNEEMLDTADEAWSDVYDGVSHNHREAMRAALTAVWHNRTAQDEFARVAASTACPACGSLGLCEDAEKCGATTVSAQEKAEPVADIDSIALRAAKDISLMWGQDRSQFVAKIQVRIIDAIRQANTAPPAERVRVPDGWKLVPIRPTPLMVGEGAWTYRQVDGDIAQCYESMVKAAPESDS
jgi:hypothetical protein